MNYLMGLFGIFCLITASVMAPLGLLPQRPPYPKNLQAVETSHCQIQDVTNLREYFLCHAAAH